MNGISKNIIYSFIFLIVLFNQVQSRILIVQKGFRITSIKSALELSNNGDTILVKRDYYSEGKIIVNKSVTLIGENFPIIDGNHKNQIMIVKSSNFKITGFQFQNSGISFISDNSAIRLDSVNNCIIENNKFLNNFFAIYLSKTRNSQIINNTIIASNNKQTMSGNGIHLWNCKNIYVIGNKIEGHRDGIYLEFVRSSFIENNYCKGNLRYGLHFMFSDSCFYRRNHFEMNKAGVAVMFTKNVTMIENNFKNNWGSSSYGLLLKDITDSKIIRNKFYKNSCGIYFESCNRNQIFNNDFIENGWAIKLMTNSMNNLFQKNNFIENTFDVSTNSTQNFNTFTENFWSNYNGYDLNKDNIGDVPFRPVKLFSFIVANNPVTLILLRSYFVEILDFAEKIIPTLTPANLLDEKPLMKRSYDKIN